MAKKGLLDKLGNVIPDSLINRAAGEVRPVKPDEIQAAANLGQGEKGFPEEMPKTIGASGFRLLQLLNPGEMPADGSLPVARFWKDRPEPMLSMLRTPEFEAARQAGNAKAYETGKRLYNETNVYMDFAKDILPSMNSWDAFEYPYQLNKWKGMADAMSEAGLADPAQVEGLYKQYTQLVKEMQAEMVLLRVQADRPLAAENARLGKRSGTQRYITDRLAWGGTELGKLGGGVMQTAAQAKEDLYVGMGHQFKKWSSGRRMDPAEEAAMRRYMGQYDPMQAGLRAGGKSIEETFAQILEDHPEWEGPRIDGLRDLARNPANLIGQVVETVPQMAGFLAISATAGPVAGSAAMFMVEFQDSYESTHRELMAAGWSDADARLASYGIGATVGMINAYLETLQIKRILKMSKAGRALMANRAKDLVRKALLEGGLTAAKDMKGLFTTAISTLLQEAGEEMGQEFTSNFIPWAFSGGDVPIEGGFWGWPNG